MGSLTFGDPGALRWLVLLAVPVAIHLLFKGERKVVLMGSLAWLDEVSSPRWSRLRLQEPLRLLLRLLLLSMIVMALARPGWVYEPPARTWVLADPALSTSAVEAALADLREQGAASLPGLARVRALTHDLPPWTSGERAQPPPGLYPMLSEADRTLGPGPFVVLATASTARLGWRRPTLTRQVTWHTVADDPRGASPATAGPDRRVAIVHTSRPGAASALLAAVTAWDAGNQRTGPRTQAAVIALNGSVAGDPVIDADWIIWLPAARGPLPDTLLRRVSAGAIVLSDVPDGGLQERLSLSWDGDVEVVRRAPPAADAVAVWRAPAGEALLTERVVGEGLHYEYLGRFTVGREVLASSALPARLLLLMSDEWLAPVPATLRTQASQARVTVMTDAVGADMRHTQEVALAPWAAVLAVLAWLCDRLLSLRKLRSVAGSAQS